MNLCYICEDNLQEVNTKLKNVILRLVDGEILVYSKKLFKYISIIPFADIYDLNEIELIK